MNVSLFTATVESVLLYESEARTLTQVLTKEIDRVHIRMLRITLNIS